MTLRDAIDRIDSLKHNTFTTAEKIAWINQLDGMVKQNIIDTHENSEYVAFYGYDSQGDMLDELLVQAPYDDMYLRWLEAQIDYHNGEIDRYNNSIAVFQTIYDSFERQYNRQHLPKTEKLKFW